MRSIYVYTLLCQLTAVQTRHLRYLLGIIWQDRILVSNTKFMEAIMSESVRGKITAHATQLIWAGHVHRMPEHRIPQHILYGELCEGERKEGDKTKIQSHA